MAAILADTVKLSDGPTSVTTPNAITDTITLVGPNGELYKITWQNLVIALGDRAAADLANVQLAYTELGKIPASLLSSFPENHKGPWLADNSSPQLSDGSGTDKDYYNVTDANSGTIDEGLGNLAIDGQSIAVGDKIVYSSVTGQWYTISQVANKFDGSATEDQCAEAGDYHRKGAVDHRQLTKAPVNGVYLDGVDDYINLGDQALLEFGDSSDDVAFSETFIFEIDDLTTAFPLSSKITGSAPNNERSVQVLTNGKIEAKLYDSSTAAYIGQTGGSVLTTKRAYFAAVTYSGNGASAGIKIYVGQVAESLTLTEAGSYTAMHAGSASAYLGRVSSTYGKGKIYSYAAWNRELSAADIALLAANGNQPQPADRWAGTTIYEADFSSDSDDGWTANNGAVDATTTVGGESDNIQFTVDGSASGHYLQKSVTLNAGIRYRFNFDYFIPSGQSNIDGIRINANGGSLEVVLEIESATTGSWQSATIEFIPSDNKTSIRVYGQDGATTSFTDAGTDDTFAIRPTAGKAFIETSGAIASYQGRNVLPTGNINDEGSNGIHATGEGVTPLFRPTAGQFVEEFEMAHGSISSSAATTTLFALPKGCRIVGIETLVDSAFDASTTLNIGITGTAAKYVNALNVAAAGRNYNSSTHASESDAAVTAVYVQKNQATTQGNAKFRVIYEITNPSA